MWQARCQAHKPPALFLQSYPSLELEYATPSCSCRTSAQIDTFWAPGFSLMGLGAGPRVQHRSICPQGILKAHLAHFWKSTPARFSGPVRLQHFARLAL